MRKQLLLLALAAATVVVYSNSLSGALVFDDIPAIVENPHIRSLWPLSQALKAPADTTVSGRPVASLSLAISRAFGDPAGDGLRAFHATNVAIHILAGLALFGVLRRTLERPAFANDARRAATGIAAAAALLWLVHPLQTASVTYVVQRTEALMGLFFLLTLYCAIRAHGPQRRAWGAAAVVACALGMGSKEVMIGAPLMVVAWDWCFAGRREDPFGPVWRGRWPLYAGLACTWLVLAASVASTSRAAAAGFGFEGWPWWRYLATQAGVILHYVRLALLPRPLVLDYGWPAAPSVASQAPQILVLAALAVATMAGLARRAPAAFAGAWFFVILAPTSSVLPIVTEIAAEHRMYLPLAAIVTLVVFGGWSAGRRAGLPRAAGLAAVGAAAIALGAATYARNQDFASEERIWQDTVAKRPANPRARLNYGVVLFESGRAAEAEPQLRSAVALDDTEEDAHLALGAVLCSTGRCAEGLPHFERAAALDPRDPKPLRNLAEAHAAHGRLAQAAGYFRRALTLAPGDVSTLNQASWLLATARDTGARDPQTALSYAERAVALTRRRDATSLDSLGVAYAELGRLEDAATALREAIAVAQAERRADQVRQLEQRLGVIDAIRRGAPRRAPAP